MKNGTTGRDVDGEVEVTPAMRTALEAYWSEMSDMERDCSAALLRMEPPEASLPDDAVAQQMLHAMWDECAEMETAARAALSGMDGPEETAEMRAVRARLRDEDADALKECQRALAAQDGGDDV